MCEGLDHRHTAWTWHLLTSLSPMLYSHPLLELEVQGELILVSRLLNCCQRGRADKDAENLPYMCHISPDLMWLPFSFLDTKALKYLGQIQVRLSACPTRMGASEAGQRSCSTP